MERLHARHVEIGGNSAGRDSAIFLEKIPEAAQQSFVVEVLNP